jgi:hypothetical protein
VTAPAFLSRLISHLAEAGKRERHSLAVVLGSGMEHAVADGAMLWQLEGALRMATWLQSGRQMVRADRESRRGLKGAVVLEEKKAVVRKACRWGDLQLAEQVDWAAVDGLL